MTSAQYAKSINTLSRATLISTNQSTDSKENMRKSVNALSRAITISTNMLIKIWRWKFGCQCPKPRNNHFCCWSKTIRNSASVCQCPKSSNNHFYDEDVKVELPDNLCQCPKSSNNHFYSYQIHCLLTNQECQCPQTRNYHFYSRRTSKYKGRRNVSMPSDEKLSFLQHEKTY